MRCASCPHLLFAEMDWINRWKKNMTLYEEIEASHYNSAALVRRIPYFRALAVVAICCAHVAKHS